MMEGQLEVNSKVEAKSKEERKIKPDQENIKRRKRKQAVSRVAKGQLNSSRRALDVKRGEDAIIIRIPYNLYINTFKCSKCFMYVIFLSSLQQSSKELLLLSPYGGWLHRKLFSEIIAEAKFEPGISGCIIQSVITMLHQF